MTIKQQLSEEILRIIKSLEIEDVEPKIDYPADPKHGDYSSNIALIAAKKLGKNPLELAEQIAQDLKSEIIEKVEVVKPGFINFWISNDALIDRLSSLDIDTFKDLQHINKGKKVVVEYSSPNIAKPFTIGHLRSTIIGDAVANLLEVTGFEVFRDSHVGDWGTQFGKQIYAIKEWGNEDEIEKSDRPVKLLVDLYVKFHQEAEKNPELEDKAREWFKKLEDGDTEARDLWKKCVDWSWKEFDLIYKQIGVPKDGAEFENNGRGYGESFFEDKMGPIIEELKEKDLLKTGKEGAKIVEFDEKTKLPPLMIIKKDGATLYATRDLATDKFRIEHYGKDILILNEVGSEQSLYFRQLYELEQMLGWFKKDQRVHISHGLIGFKNGKMSTRKGNTIWLEEVLDQAIDKAFELTEKGLNYDEKTNYEGRKKLNQRRYKEVTIKLPIQIGIGALKWNDLKRDSKQDVMFDWGEILNMQGNSGPYIQYVFARTQSVIEKSGGGDLKFEIKDLKLESEERELLRMISKFDEVIVQAAERFAPNIVCNHLFELSQAFNLFYQKCPILKAEKESRDFRLALTSKTGEVIKKGLNLLGIAAPVKM